MKQYVTIIIVTIVSFIVGATVTNRHTYETELISSYENYMYQTENMLDSIAVQYPDFMDTFAENDPYFDYTVARQQVLDFYE